MTPRRADLLAVLGLATATAVVCLPLLRYPCNLPAFPTDLCKKHAFAVSNWLTITRYGQFPFRSPWLSGGYPLCTYPEDISLSPRLFLVLAFGPWAGLKVGYMVTMFLAAWGTYLLVRRQLGWPVPAALVSAVTFAFGGYLLQRWLQGWLINTRPMIFPWVLYFWWRSRRDPRYCAACAALMAWLLLEAKYALAVLVWFMLMWMLLRLDRVGGGRAGDRIDWRRFGLLALVVLWAALLAGIKLVPFAPILWEHVQLGGRRMPLSVRQMALWTVFFAALALGPLAAWLRPRRRAISSTFLVAAAALAAFALLAPYDDTLFTQGWSHTRDALHGLVNFGAMKPVEGSPVPGPDPGTMWEEGAPIGWIGLILALAAVAFRFRQVWRWALLAVILLWIELGQGAPLNLQMSVRQLPGLNLIRQPPSWFNLYLLFCLSVLAGRGATLAADWLRRRWAGLIPWVLAAASLAYFTWIAWPRYRYTVATPLPEPGQPGKFYLVREEGPQPEHLAGLLMYRHIGVLEWGLDLRDARVAAIQPRQDRVDGAPNPRYRGEVHFRRLDSPNEVHLADDWLTPLEMRVRVVVRGPGDLCINQIRDGNWRTNKGQLAKTGSTLRVHLDEVGEYEVRLRYRPTLVYWGLGVTAVSLLAGLGLIIFRSRWRKGFPVTGSERESSGRG